MNGIIRKRLLIVVMLIIAAVLTAAIFGVLYYSGVFLPRWAKWHNVIIERPDSEFSEDEFSLFIVPIYFILNTKLNRFLGIFISV